MRENGDPRDSLLPQPGQYDSYNPKFHPLPGEWAKQQLEGKVRKKTESTRPVTELQQALAAEKARIDASMKEQGIIPGKAIYENPRQSQNTLLPTEKYASG
jgi:hypothetical protein